VLAVAFAVRIVVEASSATAVVVRALEHGRWER